MPTDAQETEDPVWGTLAADPSVASWHVLPSKQSPAGEFSAFRVHFPSANVFREDGLAAVVLEVGFLGATETQALAIVVNPTPEGEWTTVIRSQASLVYSNESLAAPTSLHRAFSSEPFYLQVMLDAKAVAAPLTVLVGAVGPDADLSVLLGAVEAVPTKEPVPAASGEELLTLLKGEGKGYRTLPIQTGHGVTIVDYAEWIYSGLFGRQQGSSAYGDLAVAHTLTDPANSGLQAGSIEATLDRRTVSGIFQLHYVTNAPVTYEANGQLFGEPFEARQAPGPMQEPAVISGQSVRMGSTELHWQAARAGTATVPTIEELFVTAILFHDDLNVS